MITQLAQDTIVWIGENPSWASFVVLLVALLESLAVVGVAVPGASIIIAAGALVGSGILPLWPVLLAAFIGAVLGDAISYWLGYHYKDRIHAIWPFTRYPGILERGTQFFERHGGKSVFLGRFVGPIRAIIPTVAGIMNMPPNRFFLINVLSALGWAPAYLLPGIILGASIEFAAEVGGRLAFLMILVVVIFVLTYWIAKHTYLFLQPRANSIINSLFKTFERYPGLRFLAASLVDPQKPETKGLISWAVLIIVLSSIFINSLVQVGAPSLAFDLSLYHWLQEFRSPFADLFSISLSYFSQFRIVMTFSIIVSIYLMVTRAWTSVLHWSGVIAFGFLAPLVLNILLFYNANTNLFQDQFPSMELTLATVCFSFFAVIVNLSAAEYLKWLSYTLVALIIVGTSLARLHLGISSFSQVIGSLSLALTWVLIIGLAYRRHSVIKDTNLRLSSFAAGILVLLISTNIIINLQKDTQKWQPEIVHQELYFENWWNGAWKQLPRFRADFFAAGKHPLNVQFSGELDKLKKTLKAKGWVEPLDLTLSTSLSWLDMKAKAKNMSILPHVHKGRHQFFTLIKELPQSESLLVIRLWYADLVLLDSQWENQLSPLWIGNISKITFKKRVGLFRVPVTDRDFDNPMKQVLQDLSPLRQKKMQRPLDALDDTVWDGSLLLMDGRK